jgi:lipopolysaccharide/colanic/teichoic acid biosynthesis glycosyltransferase
MLSTAERLYVAGTDTAHHEWHPRPSLVMVRPAAESTHRERARRVLNVAVAAVALVLVLPVMAFIAILVKLSSPGPVIYRQVRVGIDRRATTGGNWRRRVDHGGRLFTMYKFRTMTVAAPQDEAQVWATPNDPRVTPIGRVLRKYRLDELPQLVNVLKGDMNVVGPRPEQPAIFARLREEVNEYSLRQRVLPGITGWAQVNHTYDTCIDDVRTKVRLDLQYLRSASVTQDLRILARTLPVVVMRKGGW